MYEILLKSSRPHCVVWLGSQLIDDVEKII